jgi:predicted Zn-dependent protease
LVGNLQFLAHEAKAMAQNNSSKVPELLSTHPLDGNRIAKITEKLPEAQKYYQPKSLK